VNPGNAALRYALIGVLLAGCATTKGMDEAMNSWKGAPLSEAQAKWGKPSSSMPFEAWTIYTWTRLKRAVSMSTGKPSMTWLGSMEGGAPITAKREEWECTRRLLVDQAGIVVDVDWKGNNCPVWAADGLDRMAPAPEDVPPPG
jgi:hypothetical protein